MLVGEPPQTRQTSGQSVPKWRRMAPFVCGLSLSLLCLIFPPAGCAEQVVDVGLDCHGLPHILLGLAVFRIKGLFLFGQLTAGLFERVHLGELGPGQNIIHSSLGRPVAGKLGFMLGKIFLAVPRRLVAVEHGAGRGIFHRGSHEVRGSGKGRLGVPQLPGQRMKAIHGPGGLGGQRVIVAQLMLPEVLQSSGHLFEVVDLGPPFIGRALALAQPLLNVDYEIAGVGRFPAITVRMSSGS